MERSGSQKALLVISIISIIFAVLGIILGLMALAGGGLLGAVNPADLDASTAASLENSGLSMPMIGALAGIFGGAILVGSIIELICGILGVRAANDNQKIMPVWVLAIIELVFAVAGVVAAVANGVFSQSAASLLCSVAFAVVYLWIANNVKKEAGR